MTNPIQTAQDRFSQGFSCSQSVFCAFASKFGLADETALKLASPFGGGVAHQGQVCGAVTGALMALGLARGSATVDKKDETYRMAEGFVRRFQERHETILCRELIGYDLRVPTESQAAREQGVFTTLCPAFVGSAVEIAVEILDEQAQVGSTGLEQDARQLHSNQN
jgi:C_GCAxxG_C_C family probable redox protein